MSAGFPDREPEHVRGAHQQPEPQPHGHLEGVHQRAEERPADDLQQQGAQPLHLQSGGY